MRYLFGREMMSICRRAEYEMVRPRDLFSDGKVGKAILGLYKGKQTSKDYCGRSGSNNSKDENHHCSLLKILALWLRQ